MSNLDHIKERVIAARSVSGAEMADAMSDMELLGALQAAGLSKAGGAAAVDSFRMVCEAVSTGKITPRDGWATGR